MLHPTRSVTPRSRSSASTSIAPSFSPHERTNKVLGLMDEYARLGGGPESREKRELKIADILAASNGATRSQVEEAIGLRSQGATKGARTKVESWFNTRVQ